MPLKRSTFSRLGRVLRSLAFGLLGLLGLMLAGGLVALWLYRDRPAEALEARYIGESSRFMNIEGVRLHYRDEGQGRPILLLHGAFASLIGWDPWVELLSDSYRVIRFDLPAHGLTGPDPTGDYSLERSVYLTARLIDALGLKTLTLGGASLGARVSLAYAGRFPERVDRLVVVGPDFPADHRLTGIELGEPPAAARLLEYVLPRALTASLVEQAWGDARPVPRELVNRWHALWLREDQRAAQLARLSQYRPVELESLLSAYRGPLLLLWGEAATAGSPARIGPPASPDATPVTLVTYPKVGRLGVHEAGPAMAAALRDWLEAGSGVEESAARP